ncbi:MAG: GTPase ObgE [Deltaproteobacteria bacterium]|nr:GTPase ObgE [Deltaproteobacteria bacterium]
MFVDTAKVTIKSGDGGKGCVSFRREKYIAKGGPNGGDGGSGGDVIFVGDKGLNSLVKFRYSPRLIAERGRPGEGNNRTGRKGRSVTVKVPCGTIVRDIETEEILCEIMAPDAPVTLAHGGKGGKGNQHFATPTKQAPRYAQDGLPGVEFSAVLELKIIADVGLVGLPNAGKSSLITALSHATPKIADYPFTTLNPEVGVIELSDFRTIVMADIPGIIEGAAHGRGLGIQFLKHVERTRVLLFMVDLSSFADTPPHEALNTLFKETDQFGHGLKDKQFLIAANKTDLDPDGKAWNQFKQELAPEYHNRVFPISAATRQGLDKLLEALDQAVNRNDTLAAL